MPSNHIPYTLPPLPHTLYPIPYIHTFIHTLHPTPSNHPPSPISAYHTLPALSEDVRVRGYVSCVLGCPYEGAVFPKQVCVHSMCCICAMSYTYVLYPMHHTLQPISYTPYLYP
jgi:hypothetical protein